MTDVHSMQVSPKKDRKAVTISRTSLFDDLGDIPSDPVNELTEIRFNTYDGKKDSASRMEKDFLERSINGIATSDTWDFCSYWLSVLAVTTREKMPKANYAEQTRNEFIVEGCIALHETIATHDLALYQDSEAYKSENERWQQKWESLVTRFKNVLILEWLSIPTKNDTPWNHADIDNIFDAMGEKFSYDEAKVLITDPILVPEEFKAQHHTERGMKGYSTWDLDNLRTYLMWLLAKACIFFASEDSMSWPFNKERPTIESHNSYMKNVAKIIMHGEVASAGDWSETEENEAYLSDYRVVIAGLTTLIPSMWD